MAQPYHPYYPAYPQVQPYQDRLAQLQNQYQQTMPPQMPSMQQVPQTNQGLLWVQGEAGAKSYLVAPNTTVLLMDSEGSRFYLKSTDNAGMPNLRTFEYSEVTPNAPQSRPAPGENLDEKYVTRAEYNNLQEQYSKIIDRLNSFHASAAADDSAKRPAARTSQTRSKGGNLDE